MLFYNENNPYWTFDVQRSMFDVNFYQIVIPGYRRLSWVRMDYLRQAINFVKKDLARGVSRVRLYASANWRTASDWVG